MNYQAHYDRLIARAKSRTISGYSERHHIVPKCMGGCDEKSNIVRLTAEEHYVAHQLLVRMHPGHAGLSYSAISMSLGNNRQGRRAGNKVYAWLRRRHAQNMSELLKGRDYGPEFARKCSERQRGLKRGPRSEEAKLKISLGNKGKKKSPEHCAALSRARTGMKTGPRSAECRKRMSVAIKEAMKTADLSVRQTEEYKAARREQMKKIWQQRKSGAVPMPNYTKSLAPLGG